MSWDCGPGTSTVYCYQYSTHAIFLPLTPNYFQVCSEIVRELQFKTFDLVILNSDLQMMSDAINLTLLAWKLGKNVTVKYLTEMNHGWTIDNATHKAFQAVVGKEKRLIGPQSEIRIHDELGDGYGYADIIAGGRIDRFVNHLMGGHVKMLERDAKNVDFLHLPYMQPPFGGYSAVDLMSMDLFASVSKKWSGRIVPFGFASPDELQCVRSISSRYMRLPPLFTSSPQTV